MGARGNRQSKISSSLNSENAVLMTSVQSFINIGEKEHFYNGEELDMTSLLNTIPDITVEYLPLPSSISGSLSRRGKTWIIRINSLHHPHRQKFTLAHELGHYVLHKNECDSFTDTVFFRGMSNDNIERAANQFASELLMPKGRVDKLINECGVRNIGDLATHFGVSAVAMLNRIKDLGYRTKE